MSRYEPVEGEAGTVVDARTITFAGWTEYGVLQMRVAPGDWVSIGSDVAQAEWPYGVPPAYGDIYFVDLMGAKHVMAKDQFEQRYRPAAG